MKITRKELRRLIEGSVKKRGDYVIPAEDPIGDPIADLDYSDEQKPKIKTLAMSDDEENQVYANYIADMGGHEDKDTDRFGADTFSKKVQAAELGADMLNDLDIDSAISKACDYWIYENKDYLSYYDHIDQDTFAKYADYMIEEYDGDQAIVNAIKVHTTAVLDKRIKSLIDISNSAASVSSVDEKIAYYENAKQLFSTDHNNQIVEDHILFKFRSVLYPFYLDWKDYYEAEQGYDLSNPEHIDRYKERIATFKESKVRLTRGQLRKLIEASIIKRGSDYVAPIEDPLEDPRDFDFDLSDQNKEKLLGLATSDDPATQAQADSIADTLDFPSSGRFGADTLSKQTKMYDMGLDVLNDPEIDQLLDQAIKLYFDNWSEYLVDDLTYTLMQGYKYPEGPGGFQLFLKGDQNFDAKKLNIDADYFHGDRPALDIDMINSVMEKMGMLIGVKLMNLSYYNPNQSSFININLTRDYIDPETLKLAKQLSPQELNQLMAKLRKAAELFKRRTTADSIPAVTQHVYDKMMKPMYEIFTTAHKSFNPAQDMSQIKEGRR